MKNIPYMRVATSYYKRVMAPTIAGDKVEILVPWNIDTIKQDEGRDYLSQIPKYDGFTCVPNHTNYQEVYENFINTYYRLSHTPAKGSLDTTITFLNHIFGEQIELGLDYLQILYLKPLQILPILCLVSRERSTGKSTFLKWLRLVFEGNMTYLTNDNFSSQFNADWTNRLLICIDEVLFNKEELTERIKYLSTTNINKMEAKGRDKIEVEFFGKFILCSNNEENFIRIDDDEIRFWIRKVTKFESEDTEILTKLFLEIPAFLHFLQQRPLYVSKPLSRMWFSFDQIRTKALERLFLQKRSKIETPIIEALYDLFQEIDDSEIRICPKDIEELFAREKRKISKTDIMRTLKNWWALKPEDNTKSYKTYYLTSGEYYPADRRGRYYTINRNFISEKFDALMQE
ncbi:primase-helicase family protein [Bacteroides sp. 224]|uniref:primase-helicase family protein n=1 Tax=Bacteroides sp. 224 TaxID=2302936 RepID=UPI0013D15C06|nr:primase-helicase family protein [Bacteroides sp. 224]NDV66920.1 hypothetical protein [Bacteroides sp. 224]